MGSMKLMTINYELHCHSDGKILFFFVDGALKKIDFVLLNLTKGCLIPESFPIWLKSQKNVPNHYLLYYPLEEKVLRIVILSLF